MFQGEDVIRTVILNSIVVMFVRKSAINTNILGKTARMSVKLYYDVVISANLCAKNWIALLAWKKHLYN